MIKLLFNFTKGIIRASNVVNSVNDKDINVDCLILSKKREYIWIIYKNSRNSCHWFNQIKDWNKIEKFRKRKPIRKPFNRRYTFVLVKRIKLEIVKNIHRIQWWETNSRIFFTRLLLDKLWQTEHCAVCVRTISGE